MIWIGTGRLGLHPPVLDQPPLAHKIQCFPVSPPSHARDTSRVHALAQEVPPPCAHTTHAPKGYTSKEQVAGDTGAKNILADLGRYHVLPPVQPLNVRACVRTCDTCGTGFAHA